jgi:hypothetical protein
MRSALRDNHLHCHYQIQKDENSVRFTLFRTRGDLKDLLEKAEKSGVSRAIGLYQEFGPGGIE